MPDGSENTASPDAIQRMILPHAKDFKRFWKDKGPFRYALTANEFPPVLLAPEEWIFGNDIVAVIQELMQFCQHKMRFVPSPFNPKKTDIMRPEELSPWKITHFPEAWHHTNCRAFMPEGHLTRAVMTEAAKGLSQNPGAKDVAAAFFRLVVKDLDAMGYTLLAPGGKSRFAVVKSYVEEWEADETDAGLT